MDAAFNAVFKYIKSDILWVLVLLGGLKIWEFCWRSFIKDMLITSGFKPSTDIFDVYSFVFVFLLLFLFLIIQSFLNKKSILKYIIIDYFRILLLFCFLTPLIDTSFQILANYEPLSLESPNLVTILLFIPLFIFSFFISPLLLFAFSPISLTIAVPISGLLYLLMAKYSVKIDKEKLNAIDYIALISSIMITVYITYRMISYVYVMLYGKIPHL